MGNNVEISVVMAAYNAGTALLATLDSILSQGDVALEFIIVDDGSTDGTSQLLEEYAAADRRIKIIHQENRGLTLALINGCSSARGAYIARQDAGDISHPYRLAKQLSCMNKYHAALVSCGTRYVGPNGEYLYDVVPSSQEATASLRTFDIKEVRGPSHHGSTLFPRKLYEKVGGYRPEFYFGQDLDLWLRLAEHGKHYVVPQVLYHASLKPESISGLYRKEQVKLTRIMLEATSLRQRNLSEYPALTEAMAIRPKERHAGSRPDLAQALYFIGACLRKQGDGRARDYFRKSLRTYPLHLRSWYRFLLG